MASLAAIPTLCHGFRVHDRGISIESSTLYCKSEERVKGCMGVNSYTMMRERNKSTENLHEIQSLFLPTCTDLQH